MRIIWCSSRSERASTAEPGGGCKTVWACSICAGKVAGRPASSLSPEAGGNNSTVCVPTSRPAGLSAAAASRSQAAVSSLQGSLSVTKAGDPGMIAAP
ncbi:hypothetical protein G6F35_018515 [Rhizopus arrhizus]|nr:hypothetical protein G6F35_018515 [Rhizopus arrhizus]